mgnify:CR=1 FL=1
MEKHISEPRINDRIRAVLDELNKIDDQRVKLKREEMERDRAAREIDSQRRRDVAQRLDEIRMPPVAWQLFGRWKLPSLVPELDA